MRAGEALINGLEEYLFGMPNGQAEQDFVGFAWKKLSAAAGDVVSQGLHFIRQTAIDFVVGWLGKNVVKIALAKIAKLVAAPAGPAIELVSLAFNGIKWLLDNGKCIVKFLADLFRTFRSILVKPVKEIGADVVGLLMNGVKLFLSFVEKLTGVNVSQAIKDLLAKVAHGGPRPPGEGSAGVVWPRQKNPNAPVKPRSCPVRVPKTKSPMGKEGKRRSCGSCVASGTDAKDQHGRSGAIERRATAAACSHIRTRKETAKLDCRTH